MKSRLNKEIVTAQMEIAQDVAGAWKSQVLFSLNNLGVFNCLSARQLDSENIARQLEIPQHSLERLLNAGVATGYLLKGEAGYSNSPKIEVVTQKDKEGYLGNWLKMYSRWYSTFAQLEDAISQGRAIENVNDHSDKEYGEIFIKGMLDYASYRGREILKYIDLNGASHLLDVGCGPGVYSSMFCEIYEHLTCTCYDLPQSLEITKNNLEGKAFLNRLEFKEGNYNLDESYGEDYDVVFISHVLHQETEASCAKIIQKAYNCLKPGGQIIIQAMYLNDTKTSPTYASLHDMLSLLIFPGGKNYSFGETKKLLVDHGFKATKEIKMSLFNVNSLVVGEK